MFLNPCLFRPLSSSWASSSFYRCLTCCQSNIKGKKKWNQSPARTVGDLLPNRRAVFKTHLSPDLPIFIPIFTSFFPLTFGPLSFFLSSQSLKGRQLRPWDWVHARMTHTWEIKFNAKIIPQSHRFAGRKKKSVIPRSFIHPFCFSLLKENPSEPHAAFQ